MIEKPKVMTVSKTMIMNIGIMSMSSRPKWFCIYYYYSIHRPVHEEQSNTLSKMTWCRGINSSNKMKTPSFYPQWQQYNTSLSAPTVTGKGHCKIEPKAKHFSHCKKNQSSWPNQTDSSNRITKISNHVYKNFREDSNNIHR